MVSDLQKKADDDQKKFANERRQTEKTNAKLIKDISDKRKWLEVDLENEKSNFEAERKEFEMKINELLCKLSDKSILSNAGNEFEEQKKIFETEIRKLTKSLSDLSTEVMKEKITKCELQTKIDMLLEDRNSLCTKIKELEELHFNVKLSERASPDVIIQSPHYDSDGSECSFKTASSSLKTNVSRNIFKTGKQVHTSTLLNNVSVVNSVNNFSKKGKKIWKVKNLNGVILGKKSVNVTKPFVHKAFQKKNNDVKAKSFVKPDRAYFTNQPIRKPQKKFSCSYSRTDDFVHNDTSNCWFGSYYIASYKKTTSNQRGPKLKWVPKSV